MPSAARSFATHCLNRLTQKLHLYVIVIVIYSYSHEGNNCKHYISEQTSFNLCMYWVHYYSIKHLMVANVWGSGSLWLVQCRRGIDPSLSVPHPTFSVLLTSVIIYFPLFLSLHYITVFIQPWYPDLFFSQFIHLPHKINVYLFNFSFKVSYLKIHYERQRSPYLKRGKTCRIMCFCGQCFEKTLVPVPCWSWVVMLWWNHGCSTSTMDGYVREIKASIGSLHGRRKIS